MFSSRGYVELGGRGAFEKKDADVQYQIQYNEPSVS